MVKKKAMCSLQTDVPGADIGMIKIRELHDFKKHPFKVERNQELFELRRSIQQEGILVPLLVRKNPGGEGFEIIAGHRRKEAALWAGIKEVPAIICTMDDDQAVIAMIDSNLQREKILPSEKAFAYKMKLEALKHQGVKSETGSDAETADLVGKEAGDSGRKVQRYIRLTELLPELLELVDRGKIKVSPAVSLSYLSKEEQEWVLQCVVGRAASVSGTMADQLKKHSEEGKLTELAVELILCEEKKETGKVTLPGKVKQYFPKDYSNQQIEQVIFELLENWKNSQ